MPQDLFALASNYHRALPDRIRAYLHRRGIPDEIIALHRLGWDGRRITIPIFTREGTLVCFKLAKDPEDQSGSPKMLTSRGGTVELYGWERVLAKPCRLFVCEGEFDRLVLEAQGLAAVTSTGGAGAFRAEWAPDFVSIPELYLCFDRDDAGRHGAQRVGQFVPHAKIVELPGEVGPGGDVTDFFVRLGRTRDDFENLLTLATPVPVPPETLPTASSHGWVQPFSELKRRIGDLKATVPIAEVIKAYVILQPSGLNFRGRCPFHPDHHPSLMVYPATGTFHCFGCGRHGDILTFIVAIERVPFLRALDRLEQFRNQYDREQRKAA
jgi:DNA primase